jgi:hypothetical protein
LAHRGTSGIGHGISLALVKEEAHIITSSRFNKNEVNTLMHEIENLPGQ